MLDGSRLEALSNPSGSKTRTDDAGCNLTAAAKHAGDACVVRWFSHEMANATMPQGGGGSVITAAPLRKRRAEGVGPPTADVPACGIMLPAGTVPVLSFPGLFVKEKALTGVDAAVHALGGKTRAGPIVALVDAALLDLARTTRRQQDGASAAAASCDGVSGGGGGQA